MQIKKVTVDNAQESAMTWSDQDTCISRTSLEKKTALEEKNQHGFIAKHNQSTAITFWSCISFLIS